MSFSFLYADIPDSALEDILKEFPAESHVHIQRHIVAVMKLSQGASNNAKTAGTRLTRRLHYYQWVKNMGLDDDMYLEHCTQRRRNWQFGLYTAHLCSGGTIQLQAIRSTTVDRYLHDAAVFIKLTTKIDPRFNLDGKTMADPIKDVLTEYKRWEKVPDRREPWTVEMQKAFDAANASIANDDHKEDTIELALADWTALGLATGIRRSEWAQPDTKHSDVNNPEVKEGRGLICAFLPEDWEFFDNKGGKIRGLQEAVDAGIDNVARLRIGWRVQKNGDNGQHKTYTRNDRTPTLCTVHRGLRIVARYIRNVGLNSPNIPLAVYRDTQLGLRLINSKQIETNMREVAIAVLKLDPVKDAAGIKKFSAHSLRVGACQALYARGFSAYEIKHLLRWRSDAFMQYLRDIAWVARRQANALSDLAEAEEPFL